MLLNKLLWYDIECKSYYFYYMIKKMDIKENEEKFRLMIKNTEGMFYKASEDWSIEYVSGSKELCGYSIKELSNKKFNWLSIVYPEDKGCVLKEGRFFKKNKKSVKQVYRIKHKNGKVIWVEDSKQSCFDKKQKKWFIYGFVNDVTKENKVQRDLEKSEEKYRIVAEKTGHLVYDYDVETGDIVWSGNIPQIVGYTKKEFRKVNIKKWEKLVHPDDIKMALSLLKKTQDKIGKYNIEYRFRHKNGKYINIEDHGLFVASKGKKADRMFGVMEDVTERKQKEQKLRESEEKFRNIFDNSNDAIFIHALDGKILEVNATACELLKYSKEKLLKLSASKIDSAEQAKQFFKRTKKVLEKGQYLFESVHITSVGKKIPVEIKSKLIRFGGQRAVMSVVRDITEKKKTEEVLIESEEKYRNLVERANDGIVILQDRKIKYTNPRLAKMLGWTVEEVVGSSFLKFVHPSELKNVLKNYINRMRGKKIPPVYESVFKNKKGEKVDVELNAGLINYDGHVADMVIIRDVTDRKKNEKELKNRMQEIQIEKDKINAIIQSIGDGVFVVDKNMNVKLINKAALDLSGFKEKDILDKKYKNFLKFVFEKNLKVNKTLISDVILKGENHLMRNHIALVDKNDEKIPVSVGAAPLFGENKKVSGVVVVFRDVTRERYLDSLKSEFVSVASHQLRTPLSGIKWFTELLLKQKVGKLNEGQKDYIKQVHISNERLIKLVSDLLDVSHVETGKKFYVEKKRTNILKIINQVLDGASGLINDKKIKIDVCNDELKDIILYIDPDKIRQVFYNLITNAINYSKAGGKIEICSKADNGNYVFYIKDEGVGIPKREQKRVFEKFFRASNVSTVQTEGTGLGLYIARANLEAHDGKIWFESKLNKGTTFFVSLPKKQKNK